MSTKSPATGSSAARAAIQKLESLQRAGVTHLGKIPHIDPPPAAPQAQSSPEDLKKGPGLICAKHPPGRSGKLNLVPFSARESGEAAEALAEAARDVAACTRCSELARTRKHTVFGEGSPNARLVFLGEAPGADEDRQGRPFVGRAGQLFDKILAACTLTRQKVYILNILKCRPPGNRNPEPVEAAACREHLDRQLAIIQPEFICCLGSVAAKNLLETSAPIGRLRGRFHDHNGIKVLCTYHPAYLLRNPAAKRQVWDDMQLLMAEMGIELPKRGARDEG